MAAEGSSGAPVALPQMGSSSELPEISIEISRPPTPSEFVTPSEHSEPVANAPKLDARHVRCETPPLSGNLEDEPTPGTAKKRNTCKANQNVRGVRPPTFLTYAPNSTMRAIKYSIQIFSVGFIVMSWLMVYNIKAANYTELPIDSVEFKVRIPAGTCYGVLCAEAYHNTTVEARTLLFSHQHEDNWLARAWGSKQFNIASYPRCRLKWMPNSTDERQTNNHFPITPGADYYYTVPRTIAVVSGYENAQLLPSSEEQEKQFHSDSLHWSQNPQLYRRASSTCVRALISD